jgi:thioredoxin
MKYTILLCVFFLSLDALHAQDKPIHLDKASFEERVATLKSLEKGWTYLGDKPCLIDFYADWCGPCKTIAPHLEALAKEFEGKIYIYKINTDKEKELAKAFGITAIPTLVFAPLKEDPQVAQGALPKNELKRLIETILLPQSAENQSSK